MISSYNITTQAVLADGVINFTTDRILTGCTATRDGQTFQLNKPGYYYVTFNAVATATEVGEITATLENNGIAVVGATASMTAGAVGDLVNLAFTTIIKVPPSCCAVNNVGKLTVVNAGVGATYTNVNLNITKLC